MSLVSPKQLYRILQYKNPELVMCVNQDQIPQICLSGSTLFILPNNIEDLFEQVTRIQSNKKELHILYDTGLIAKAAILYWCMKAAGFTNLKVLAGGFSLFEALGIELEQGCPPLHPLGQFQGNSLGKQVMSLNEFIHTDTLNRSVLRAVNLSYQLLTGKGDLIRKQKIQEILERNIEEFQRNKSYLVFGKYSGLAGMYLEVLGEKDVVVVVGDTNLEISQLRSMGNTVESSQFTLCQSQMFFDAHELIQQIPSRQQVRRGQQKRKNQSEIEGNCACICLIL